MESSREFRRRNHGSGRSGRLPKFTELGWGRSETQSQALCLQSPCSELLHDTTGPQWGNGGLVAHKNIGWHACATIGSRGCLDTSWPIEYPRMAVLRLCAQWMNEWVKEWMHACKWQPLLILHYLKRNPSKEDGFRWHGSVPASCGRLLHWLPPMDHVFQNSHFCVVPPTLSLGWLSGFLWPMGH